MSMSLAEQEVLDALCRTKFAPFAERAFRIYNPATAYEYNWHIGCIAEHLEAAYRGELKRLIINVPPRSLKSYLFGEAFPAWVLGHEPHRKFIVTSYGHGLAKERAQNCRYILQDEWYQYLFPKTRIDNNQNEKHNFKTTQHGGYYAAGILGTITGKGADYVLADDPVKPDEALSETVRNHTNEAFKNTLFSRFNDDRYGRFIMVMQRLHEDDPTGFLLARDAGFHCLKLPAIAHEPVKIHLGTKHWEMTEGQLLFPERLTKEILDQKREDLGEYNFVGQYLQEPAPLGGGEFKDSWIRYYQAGGVRPAEMNIVILCDPSAGEESNKKKKKRSDWSAFMVVGLGKDKNYYLLDIVRDRFNPTERVNMLFELHRKWSELSGKPPRVGYERYGMMADIHYCKKKQHEDGYYFELIELGGSTSKEDRIRRLIPDLQLTRWYFPANIMYTDKEGRLFDLVKELVYSEMPSFPRARFDDMLDALSRVYEDNLSLVWPQPKPSMVATAMSEMAYNDSSSYGWQDF